jgi:hypothetical protein
MDAGMNDIAKKLLLNNAKDSNGVLGWLANVCYGYALM